MIFYSLPFLQAVCVFPKRVSSRDSIIFEVLSILNVQYDECFGFTDEEVRNILKDYNLSEHYPEIREWYDGYRFGNADIYCPWDVIRYCKSLCMDATAVPEDFWSNSSGNTIVRRFIDKADASTKDEIERLIAGESIENEVPDDRTGMVIELKYAENGDMDAACREALQQIEDREYIARLKQDGMRNFIKYGIACYKKDCRVVVGE